VKKVIIGMIVFVIIAICVIIMTVMSSSTSSKNLINQEIKHEIEKTHSKAKYYVSEIEDDGSILRVTLTLRFTPSKEIELQNIALPTCMEIAKLLKKHSQERNVSVWLQKPAQTKGFFILYGRAFYSIVTGTVEWELKK